MNIARLSDLVETLNLIRQNPEADAPVEFNMEEFLTIDIAEDAPLLEDGQQLTLEDFNRLSGEGGCSTAGCAVGHHALQPHVMQEGFYFAFDEGSPEMPDLVYRKGNEPGFVRGWKAVCAYYEIPHDDAYFLFNQDEYDRRGKDLDLNTVIDRIEYYIGRKSSVDDLPF